MRITLNLLGAAAASFVIMFAGQWLGLDPEWFAVPFVVRVLLALVAAPFELALMPMGRYPRR
jgi:hypothetical protein